MVLGLGSRVSVADGPQAFNEGSAVVQFDDGSDNRTMSSAQLAKVTDAAPLAEQRGADASMLEVVVPSEVSPNETFNVMLPAGGGFLQVQCPAALPSNRKLTIRVPIR